MIRDPCHYSGHHEDMHQNKDYVVLCFHWEYFGTCAIVRATDGDALCRAFISLAVAIRSISESGPLFGRHCHKDFVISVIMGSIRISTSIGHFHFLALLGVF